VKIRPYVEKLEKSKEYLEFKQKYSDAFMAAGFFVLDFEMGANVHQIDFYVPSEKKFAAFTLDEGINLQLLDVMKSGKAPEELDLNTNIDLDALQGILLDEMHNRGMSEEIKKIIAVIQRIDGKKLWSVNCVLSGMEILKARVEDDSKTVLKIEKSSLLDLVKKIPSSMMRQKAEPPMSEEDKKKQLENLEKIEAEIKKEKEKLKGEVEKKDFKKVVKA
jgi:hypothetical protein